MNWDDLRFVLAVARAASLSGAARELGVSHSTVYRRLKAFEEGHDILCFERLADGMRITAEGEALIGPITDVERGVLEVERGLSSQQHEVAGTVTLAAPEALALTLCAQLGPLLSRYPKLQVHWKIGVEEAVLQKGEADVALRVMAAPAPSLVGRKVWDLGFGIYATHAHLDAHPWGGVAAARWVTFDDVAARTPQGKWEAANVPAAQVVMRVNRRALLDAAIVAGHGVGITACGLGDQAAHLVRVGDPIPELTVPLWVLTHASLQDVPRVRALMDMCVELLVGSRALLEGSGG